MHREPPPHPCRARAADGALPRRRCLAFAAASLTVPLPAWARPAPSLPLVLARPAPADVDPAPYLVSEKLDGVRGYWDGQRLWFRSGLPVAAPAWFTAGLPALALDGELWLGRGRFEGLVAAVRRQRPQDDEWQDIRLRVFEQPGGAGRFDERVARLQALAAEQGARVWSVLEQWRLADRAALRQRLAAVVADGGEGLMLHQADAPFVAGRNPVLLKLKPLADAEAEVIGHVPGRGRLQGLLGALRVRTVDGAVFLIGSGFSDAERAAPPPLGSWVSFSHRGLTDRGIPRFASYLRVREL